MKERELENGYPHDVDSMNPRKLASMDQDFPVCITTNAYSTLTRLLLLKETKIEFRARSEARLGDLEVLNSL